MSEAPAHRGPGWWRRNRFWLPGALVLGVLAFLLPYRANLYEYGRRGFDHPIDAAADGWTPYQGSRWRLVEVLRDDGASDVVADYPHSKASLLALVYEVVPRKGVTPDALDLCHGRLTDAKGRAWGGPAWGGEGSLRGASITSSAQRRVERALDLSSDCGSRHVRFDQDEVKARPGRPFRFAFLYVIPRDLPTQGLRGEIELDPYNAKPPGSYLRFTLGASRAMPADARLRR